MDITDIWGQLDGIAGSSEDEIDLARAALLIAATEYPSLNIERELYRLSVLADGVAHRLEEDNDPLFALNTLSEYLFDELGFKANHDDYYDPRNSFLNEVLERRLGIPITLSLVYLEVGKRVGVPLMGIGMPGHFLVKHRDVSDLFVDPYHNGVLLSIEECKNRLTQVTQGSVRWDAGHLQSIGGREFVARILRNLKAVYLQKRDYTRVLNTIDRLLVFQPQASQERRDRGVVNYRLGNYQQALDDLQGYADSAPRIQDSDAVYRLIEQIQGILKK